MDIDMVEFKRGDGGDISNEELEKLVQEIDLFASFKTRNLRRLSDDAFLRVMDRTIESISIIQDEMEKRGFDVEETVMTEFSMEIARRLIDIGDAETLRQIVLGEE